MQKIKYLIQFTLIYLFFIICKFLKYKKASNFGSSIMRTIGPFFRSKKIINKNLNIAYPNISNNEKNNIIKNMWENYGRILADYMFIKDFRKKKLNDFVNLNGLKILENVKKENQPVIFISGHFNNFELLAMNLEMAGIDIATVYRPLNNIFLNKIMMKIRENYICKKQIPKGIPGVKKSLKLFKEGTSLALMIDQRVSEGEKIDFYGQPALTTTIPAQFIKKYNCAVIPVYIERTKNHYFRLEIEEPLKFTENISIKEITQSLNNWLEKKINYNPNQWIWTHDRWK